MSNSLNAKVFWCFLLVLCVGMLLSPFIFFGLDITDAGWCYSNAWLHGQYPHQARWNIGSFGTALIGGLWFDVFPTTILSIRASWVVMGCVYATIVYIGLVRYYSPKRLLIPILATVCVAMLNSEEFLLIEYHSFPALLCVFAVVLLSKGFDTENICYNNHFVFVSGVVSALCVLARLPLVLFVATIFALTFFAEWLHSRRAGKKFAPIRLALYAFGIIVGGSLAIGFLYVRGFPLERVVQDTLFSFKETTYILSDSFDDRYPPLYLATAIKYIKLISMGGMFLGIAYVLQRSHSIFEKLFLGKVSVSLIVAVLLGFLTIAMIIPDYGSAWIQSLLGWQHGILFAMLLGLPLLIIAVILIGRFSALDISQVILFAGALFVFVFASLGNTGTWVTPLRHGIWIAFPLALLVLQDNNVQGRVFTILDKNFLKNSLLIVAIVMGIVLAFRHPYRDKPILEHDAVFSYPTLSGVHSSASRVQGYEEMLHVLSGMGMRSGDTIQTYPNSPGLYFITQTMPWYKEVWIGNGFAPYPTLKNFLNRVESDSMSLPKLVIRTKINFNDPGSFENGREYTFAFGLGEDKKVLPYGNVNWECARALDSFFFVKKYQVIWENKGFAVLSR